MTAPLTLTVSETKAGTEVTDSVKDTPAADTDKNEKTDQPDTFTYAGKTYVVTVGGRKKSDTVHETKYEYNGKNQLISYTDPEGREETYTYDVNGNLTRTVDKNGNTLENTYDYQNRLTATAEVPKGQGKKKGKETTHTFRYNAYGEVSAQDDTVFAYGDVSGQVTEETAELTKNKKIVKKYEYDSAGNRTTFSVGAGGETKLSLTYAYDGMSRLTSVKDENGEDTVLYNYDTEGNLSGRTVPGAGLTTAYTYDCQNRLITLQNRTDRAGVVSGYRSAYLLNGKKSEETSECLNKDGEKETKTANYTYDMLGRVTKEEKTGNADITYTYDNHNNRKQMKAGNKLTAYKYNQNDELLRIDTLNTDTEEDSVILYKNDRNGNQLATVNRYPIPDDKKTGTYVDIDVTLGDNRLNGNVVNHYNAQNELIQTLTRGYKVSFTYDAAGLRNSKTVNGEKTVYVWDGDQLVLELSGSGKIQNRYIRGVDLIYADRGEDTGKQYYVTDPHGNVVQLIDGSGEVVRTYEYDSFGNEVDPDSRDENPFRYCGEYFDRETGEVYLRARYYRPETGRFLTRDTYTGEAEEPLSLHLYTYCENDGVNGVDPSGHWMKEAVHNNMTQIIAISIGYTESDAKLFGISCAAADRVYKGPKKGLVWETTISGIKITQKDISGATVFIAKSKNVKGKRKIELHHPKDKDELAEILSGKKINKIKQDIKDSKKRKIVTALWLHMVQDYYAHGFLNERSHIAGSDDIEYDYNSKKTLTIMSKKKLKGNLVKNNSRLRKMVRDTKKYLKKARDLLGLKNTGLRVNTSTLYKNLNAYFKKTKSKDKVIKELKNLKKKKK